LHSPADRACVHAVFVCAGAIFVRAPMRRLWREACDGVYDYLPYVTLPCTILPGTDLPCTFFILEAPCRVRFGRRAKLPCTIFVISTPHRVQIRAIIVHGGDRTGQKTYTVYLGHVRIVHGSYTQLLSTDICTQPATPRGDKQHAVGK
jgi:hypothetical protein